MELPDRDAITDPKVRKIYDLEGYSLALDLTRVRKDMGLTFSAEALEEYVDTLRTFVATRVMKHWAESGEPPVRMTTLVTVAINQAGEVEHDERPPVGVNDVLEVAQQILDLHSHVAMDTPEDKALHARAIENFQNLINIYRARIGDTSWTARPE